jgi:hypothetical protein
MTLRAFLLKLVGRHPDQVRERARFEENLRLMGEKDKELDELLNDIHETDKAIQSGGEIRLASTYPPPDDGADEEHQATK